VFGDLKRISTATLLRELNAIETSPWATLRNGEALDSRTLARYLHKYEIETNNTLRVEGETVKGYAREGFLDAWARYAPAQEHESKQEHSDELF
jgi:hypothetical protein